MTTFGGLGASKFQLVPRRLDQLMEISYPSDVNKKNLRWEAFCQPSTSVHTVHCELHLT